MVEEEDEEAEGEEEEEDAEGDEEEEGIKYLFKTNSKPAFGCSIVPASISQ